MKYRNCVAASLSIFIRATFSGVLGRDSISLLPQPASLRWRPRIEGHIPEHAPDGRRTPSVRPMQGNERRPLCPQMLVEKYSRRIRRMAEAAVHRSRVCPQRSSETTMNLARPSSNGGNFSRSIIERFTSSSFIGRLSIRGKIWSPLSAVERFPQTAFHNEYLSAKGSTFVQ